MPRKLTTHEFIKKARVVHGDKYDYSKVDYIGTLKKVIITCSKHGDFEQTPNHHLHRGQGCPHCGGNARSTTKDFIKKARVVHGDKYDYSKVEYVTANTKVIITCPIHGDFEQIPNAHINGQGCPRCAVDIRSSNQAMNTEEFIEKAMVAHNDKYDYSKVVYVNNRSKVIITCPIHGDFKQRPYDHLGGKGCPRCKKSRTSYDKMTVEQRQRVKDVYIYHLRFEGNGEIFDKIGISGDLPSRIRQIQNDSKKAYKLVSGRARKYENADIAYEMEYKLLEKQQLTNDNRYIPKISFGGDTECIVPRGNPTMFDSTCIPERSDRFNYDDYKG